MAIRTLPRDDWKDYFDTASSRHYASGSTKYASVRVLSIEDGDQPLTEWAPLLGLTYEPKNHLLEIQMDGLDHLVAHPETIYVDEDGASLAKFEVVRADGAKEIVELR